MKQQIINYIKQAVKNYLDSWKIDDLHYAIVDGNVYSDTVEFTGWVNPYLQYQYAGKPAFKFTYNRF